MSLNTHLVGGSEDTAILRQLELEISFHDMILKVSAKGIDDKTDVLDQA